MAFSIDADINPALPILHRNRPNAKLRLAISLAVLFPTLLLALAAAKPLFAQRPTDASLPDAPVPQGRVLGGASFLTRDQRSPPQEQTKKQNKKRKYSPSATSGSPGHIFWVVPAYKVDYGKGFKPLTPKEKFQEWAQSSYDPLGLGVGAFEAGTLEYSSTDGFCGYGKGWGGYGECFGSLELDSNVSSFIGDYALAVALHQDPRYFRMGEGSAGRRAWYAVARVFVTYNDSGHTVFYSSALSGTVIAAALSNFYYPAKDVGAGHTMSRIAIDLGNTAIYDAAAEFWPDIHRGLHRMF